jgi:hypothetical protein
MGTLLMEILVVGCVGYLFYYLFYALHWRALAKLLQLTCFALVLASALTLILQVADWVTTTPIYRFFAWFGRG